MNYKRISIILFILSFIMILIGSTFAYWTWQSADNKKTVITFTVGDGFSCSADGGGDIVGNNLAPSPCTNDIYVLKRKIDVSTTTDVSNYYDNNHKVIDVDLWLEIETITSGLANSDHFKYALTTSGGSCEDGVIHSGVFKNNIVNNKITLLNHEDKFVGTDSKTYWLYIWLDEEETDPATMNQIFKASLNGECRDTGEIVNKKYVSFGSYNSYFKNSEYKDKITSISIVNNTEHPSDAISWNLGYPNQLAVVGWLEDDGSGNDTYDLKIGTDGEMYSREYLSHAFYNMINVKSINLSGLNTSETRDMSCMFQYTGSNVNNFSLNLGNSFYTSNVTNSDAMFSYAGYNATNFDFSLGNNFDTSNITTMSSMFSSFGVNATNFDLNLGNRFNTSNVTNMSSIFSTGGIKSLNLGSSFDTSNVTDMSGMFSGVGRNATDFSLNLGNHFDTSKVTSMSFMFSSLGQNATNFNLNLGSSFDTSNVTYMAHMFRYAGYNATNLNLDLGAHFNTSKVTSMASMFLSVGRFSNNFKLNLGESFDTSNVTSMDYMFYDAGYRARNYELKLGNHFNTSKVTNMDYMFSYSGMSASSYNLDLGESFNTANVTSMVEMFQYVGTYATDFNLNLGSHFDTSKVTNMYNLFFYVGNAARNNFILDMSKFDFTNVTNSDNMLNGFPTAKGIIYVKDEVARDFVISKNSGFNASNVLIKSNS